MSVSSNGFHGNGEERPLSIGRRIFNTLDPNEGIAYLQEHHAVGRTAEDVACFLLRADGLSRKAIGQYLGEKDEFNVETLKAFAVLHDFTDVDIVLALRRFLSGFHLPGEAQKIDRMMNCFAQRYCTLNPSHFPTTDACYVLSFSLIMLNTSLHNPHVRDRLSLDTFVTMNRSVRDDLTQLPLHMLTSAYEGIKSEPFKVPEEPDASPAFYDPVKQGWLRKRGGRYKSWKRRWFVLKDNCLYYFRLTQDRAPKGIIPLENLGVRDIADRHRSHCFELYSQTSGLIKACKTVANGGRLVPGHHRVFRMSASNAEERQHWSRAIRSSLSENPVHRLILDRCRRPSTTTSPPSASSSSSPQSPQHNRPFAPGADCRKLTTSSESTPTI